MRTISVDNCVLLTVNKTTLWSRGSVHPLLPDGGTLSIYRGPVDKWRFSSKSTWELKMSRKPFMSGRIYTKHISRVHRGNHLCHYVRLSQDDFHHLASKRVASTDDSRSFNTIGLHQFNSPGIQNWFLGALVTWRCEKLVSSLMAWNQFMAQRIRPASFCHQNWWHSVLIIIMLFYYNMISSFYTRQSRGFNILYKKTMYEITGQLSERLS